MKTWIPAGFPVVAELNLIWALIFKQHFPGAPLLEITSQQLIYCCHGTFTLVPLHYITEKYNLNLLHGEYLVIF